MKKKMLQCTNQNHAKLRLVSHSTSSLYFWEVDWNINLLLLFVSRRDVAISEYKFWNVTVLQTVRFSLFCQYFSFQSIGRSWGKNTYVKKSVSYKFWEPCRAHCSTNVSCINQVQMLPWFFPSASQMTHIQWLLVPPPSPRSEQMTGILAPLLSPNKPLIKITRKVILQFTFHYRLSI